MKNLLTPLLMTIATYGCSNEKDSILIPINSENIESGSSGSIYTKLEEQDLKVSLRVLNGLPNLKNGDFNQN